MAWVVDPNQEILTVGGIDLADGHPASGDRMTWEYPDPVGESFGGATPGYSMSLSRRAIITINLVQGSLANRVMLGQLKLQVGAVTSVVARRAIPGQPLAGEKLVAPTAIIQKAATTRWATGEVITTWTLESAAATGGPIGLPDAPQIDPSEI